jgi:hypothetical protein
MGQGQEKEGSVLESMGAWHDSNFPTQWINQADD